MTTMKLPSNLSYYDLLQVSSSASQEVIRGAYRALLKEGGNHPDLGGNPVDAQLINEAYQVLSDPRTRKEYDLLLASQSYQQSTISPQTLVMLVCPHCRTRNQLPDNQHLERAHCKKCNKLLLTPPSQRPNETEPMRAHRLGIFLFEKGLFIRAQHEFENALRYQPHKPQFHYWLGRCRYQRRQLPQARRSFLNALLHDPHQFHYHFWNAQSLYDLKAHHEAAKAFQQALHLRPKHWPTMMRLASAQFRSGNALNAIETLDQAIAVEPTRSEFHTLKGMVHLSLKDRQPSLQAFQQAQKLNPHDNLANKYIQILS